MSARILTGRRVRRFEDIEQPGDYYGPDDGGSTDGRPAVSFLKPNSRDPDAPERARYIQHVCSPPHTYRECPDGSLEIRNSIGDTAGASSESDGWHGFLDEGHIWRQV